MKTLFIVVFSAFQLCSLNLYAQFSLQAGALAAPSKTSGFGGEITGNFQLKNRFSVGAGTRPVKFREHHAIYLPVYASLKYYHPLSRSRLFASIDPGYGFYPSEDVSENYAEFRRTGALYLSGGIGIMGNSRLSPYASVNFTKFGFAEKYGIYSQYRPISTFVFAAGIAINRPAGKSGTGLPPDSPSTDWRSPEEYLRKSERQKKTGWILLGSGAALIAGGIIIARHEDKGDGYAAIPLVLISGPGVIASLISVPFFISSAHNRKRAASISTVIGWKEKPGIMAGNSAVKKYPALGLRVGF